MANPLTLAHVANRYPGTLTAQQEINAQVWIEDIWTLLLERRPTIETEIGTTVLEGTVIRVLAEAVVRKLLNPERKVTESIDDYAFRREDGIGVLALTDEDLGDLTPPTTTTGTRNSVRLVAYGES